MAVMRFEQRTGFFQPQKSGLSQEVHDVIEVGAPVAQQYAYRMLSTLLKNYLVSLQSLYDLAAGAMVFTIGRLIKYSLYALVAQSSVFVAKRYGDYVNSLDQREQIKKNIRQIIYNAWALGAFLSVVGVFACLLAPSLLAWIVTNPVVLQKATEYCVVYGLSLPMRFFNDISLDFLSSLREHATYVRLSRIHFVADVGFALLLIPIMGLSGAAYAVLFSAIVTTLSTAVCLRRSQSAVLQGLCQIGLFIPDFSMIRAFVLQGLPSSLSTISFYGVLLCSSLMANLYGIQVLVEYLVVKEMLSFLYNIFCGFAWAGKVLVAQNLPSETSALNDITSLKAVESYGWIASMTLPLAFLVAASLMMLMAPCLIYFVIQPAQSLNLTNLLFVCLTFTLAKTALLWQNASTQLLEGMKDTLFSSVSNVASMLLITIPLQYMCYNYGLGFFSLGIAMALGASSAAMLNSAYFFQRTKRMTDAKNSETSAQPYVYDCEVDSSNAVFFSQCSSLCFNAK